MNDIKNLKSFWARVKRSHSKKQCWLWFGGKRPRGDRNGARLHPEKLRRGEHVGISKLKPRNIVAIRALRSSGWAQQRIADKFSVRQSTISSIVLGLTWRHVK